MKGFPSLSKGKTFKCNSHKNLCCLEGLSSLLLSSHHYISPPLCYKWPHVGNERIVISNLIMLHDSIKTTLLYQTPTISRDNLITKCQTATAHLGVIFIHAKVICFSIMN